MGGISPALEGEEMPVQIEGFKGGDRTSIELPKVQRDFLKALKEAGKKVPVGGYPTPGALFQFIHKNRYDFYRLLKARAKTNGVELPAA